MPICDEISHWIKAIQGPLGQVKWRDEHSRLVAGLFERTNFARIATQRKEDQNQCSLLIILKTHRSLMGLSEFIDLKNNSICRIELFLNLSIR